MAAQNSFQGCSHRRQPVVLAPAFLRRVGAAILHLVERIPSAAEPAVALRLYLVGMEVDVGR